MTSANKQGWQGMAEALWPGGAITGYTQERSPCFSSQSVSKHFYVTDIPRLLPGTHFMDCGRHNTKRPKQSCMFAILPVRNTLCRRTDETMLKNHNYVARDFADVIAILYSHCRIKYDL